MYFHAEFGAFLMKMSSLLLALGTLFAGAAAFAQAPAAPSAAASAAAAPSKSAPPAPAPSKASPSASSAPTVRAVCKDGTAFEGTTLRGACSGHGGIDKGAAGQVWVSEGSDVYHCKGDRLFGKTKSGQYMSEADAKAKGLRAVKGSKTCAP